MKNSNNTLVKIQDSWGESEGVEHDAAAILLTQEATSPQEGTTQSILEAKHNTPSVNTMPLQKVRLDLPIYGNLDMDTNIWIM